MYAIDRLSTPPGIGYLCKQVSVLDKQGDCLGDCLSAFQSRSVLAVIHVARRKPVLNVTSLDPFQ